MGRSRKQIEVDRTRVVAYVRVSSGEQAASGLGMAAQRAAIEAEAGRRGWTIVAWREDAGVSGKSLDRPGLSAALADVEEGRAAALVVAKLDRLSRSLLDFAGLMDRSWKAGWAIVALDLGVDTTTAQGELMASVFSSFAQFERRLIGQRTKSALAVKSAQGVKLGRPRMLPDEVVARIVRLHDAGEGWTAIARMLNADDVPTAQGGAAWHPTTVRYVYFAERREAPTMQSEELQQVAEV